MVRLDKVCRFEKGTSPTLKTEPGKYPLVVTADFRRTSSDFQFNEPAVCIPLVSSTGHGNAAIHRIHFQDGRCECVIRRARWSTLGWRKLLIWRVSKKGFVAS